MARDVEHASFFSYSVQRPYPLRWFTPVAIVGGIILTALISFANFVASGYQLTTVYSSDPTTIDQHLWFKNWPGLLRSNVNATCDAANLPVNSQFFTNQTALAYTLTSIVIAKDGVSSTSSSLPYMNNVLKHCEILNITMDFSCSPLQNPTQIASSPCTVDVRAYSTCAIDGPNGLATFNCSSFYNPVQSHFSPGSSSLIDVNATSRASLWWAQQLLTAYWFDTDMVLYETLNPYNLNDYSTYNSDKDIVEGSANFYRHEAQEDITKLDFFDVSFQFTGLATTTFFFGRNSVKAFVEEPDTAGTRGPPIWRQADRLAKSMYSAVMTDLGQTTLRSSSNIVANPNVVQIYSERFASLHSVGHVTGLPDQSILVLNGTFDDLRASVGSGPLDITPSVISTNYLCSVPRMKSTGSIFIAILLADLVFLNAAWFLYCLIVGRFFVRSPTANYCEGCLNTMHEFQPLIAVPKSNASSVPKLPVLEFESASSTNSYEPVQLRRAGSLESLVDRADQPGRYSLR
jgi:hypothetical protein